MTTGISMVTFTGETSIPFARSRALKWIGGGLLAVALRLTLPAEARAGHGAAPSPCVGFGECHCCTGPDCCSPGCTWPGPPHTHCGSGTQCWYTCVNVPDPIPDELYRCCDWHDPQGDVDHCICREFIGGC